MVIHLVVPEQRLITISPEEIPCPDILVRKLKFLFRKRTMHNMIVMFAMQLICIEY
jgi:hypothetical protein